MVHPGTTPSRCIFVFLLVSVSDAAPIAAQSDCNANAGDGASQINGAGITDCNRNLVADECDLRPHFELGTAATYDSREWPVSLAEGDLDGDGKSDLAVLLSSNEEFKDLLIWYGRGNGAFGGKPEENPGRSGSGFDHRRGSRRQRIDRPGLARRK